MRTLLFVFLIGLFGQRTDAQIVFEHQYAGIVSRIKLQHAGEKYYEFNQSTRVFIFYNADHTFWKSFSLPVDTAAQYYFQGLSDQKLNNDTLIEIILSVYYSTSGKGEIHVVNELGAILLKAPGYNAFLSEIPGISSKLLVSYTYSTTSVYSVPQLTLEHQFLKEAARITVDNIGERYFSPVSDTILGVFKSDFSLHKLVPLPSVISGSNVSAFHASQQRIFTDTLIEIILRRGSEVVILNESGKVLYKSYSGTFFQFSEISGYPDKICDYESVYTLPGLIKEHTYKGFFAFRYKFAAGPTYVMGWNDSIRVFDANHKLRTRLKAKSSPGLALYSWQYYADYAISPDPKIEVGYVSRKSFMDSYSESRIMNEDTVILFKEPGGYALTVSEVGAGTQHKLLSYLRDSTSTIIATKVYGLPSYDLTDIKKLGESKSDLVIFPNPATDYFELKIDNFEVQRIRIYDSGGTLISDTPTQENDRIKINYLDRGIYLIVFQDRDGKSIPKKLIKQ